MSENQKIRDKYAATMNKEIEELQANCKHEKSTDWMEEWWAPGHSTGMVVKQCARCGKELERSGGRIKYVLDKTEKSGLRSEVHLSKKS